MGDSRTFQKLFEPGQIGQLRIKNRIVMPAMQTLTGTTDGFVTQQTKDYYETRAKGGAGLIIAESACVEALRGKDTLRQFAIDDDKFIPDLSQLSDAIKAHGARSVLQLSHAGSATQQKITHAEVIAPSAIARPGCDLPRSVTEGEIADLIGSFVRAAERAKKAGFDGIEIHGAHGYLIAQFLSSAWNRRRDRYGGALENRARFLVEILRAARESLGKLYPIFCRINGEETGFPGGTTPEEAQAVARIIEPYCDAVNVSTADSNLPAARPHFFPPGWAAPLAIGVKEAIHLPVIGMGRLAPEVGERLLREGKLDFIAMGRALRADPELPNKLSRGEAGDIRPCIVCNVCMETLRPTGERLCAVNPDIGRERDYEIQQSPSRKRVLVAGGGPAGMEAARVAALRGHEVTLWEEGDRLGGKLLVASVPPFKEQIAGLADYLSSQIQKSGVRVELNKKATPALIKGFEADAVVLASGAIPLIPRIRGIDVNPVVTAEDVLGAKVGVGNRIVVLGGGQVGCETAAFLAENGKQVTVCEMLDLMACDMGKRQGREILIHRLAEKGVVLLTQTKGVEISGEGLVAEDQHGEELKIAADTVVFACGALPNKALFQAIEKVVPEVYTIGDCTKAGKILEAIDEGSRVARLI